MDITMTLPNMVSDLFLIVMCLEEDRYEQEAISSAQRVRRALFPDIYDSYPASSSPSFLDQLAGPSLDLQNAIIDLLNVEDEMQTFSKTMAGLVSLLVSSDPVSLFVFGRFGKFFLHISFFRQRFIKRSLIWEI